MNPSLRLLILLALALASSGAAWADAVRFRIPAQSTDRALADFTEQSGVEILFSPEQLVEEQSPAVYGAMEPADALVRLLRETEFSAVRQNGILVVTKLGHPRGELVGRVTPANGEAPMGTRVEIPALGFRTHTNRFGEYHFNRVPFGLYTVEVERAGFHPLRIAAVSIQSREPSHLPEQHLQPVTLAQEMETVVVEGQLNRYGPLDPGPTVWGPRQAGGNLDLTRTVNDALPFLIYDRDRITRSGAVNLNDFLRTELLDTDATALPPNQDGSSDLFSSGSSNLNLRGFGADETVVLVNGRRLPEVLTALGSEGNSNGYQPPDVNFIPLSLVQQVQVLPASASALYSGNAVGGVINILLRPDRGGRRSEITTTYTNATEGFDAPYVSVSMLHSDSLLEGKLNVRVNANFVSTNPATEAQLKYQRDNQTRAVSDDVPLFGATPNVRVVGPGRLVTGSNLVVTSVPPGGDGSAGLSAFAGRENQRNYGQFDSPGTVADGINGIDFPYGRHQDRALFFASALYDATPWLELGLDAAYSQSTTTRGFDVFTADLLLRAENPLSPFDEDARVSLFETPVELGQNYNEAKIDFYSLVGSALLRLPGNWSLLGDTQIARSVTQFRGVAEVDQTRWQELVDRGAYNPLRDTQIFGPPQAFYDEVVVYTGARDKFTTLGDYTSFDGAFRLTNDGWDLPTGKSVFNFGADYRITSLGDYLAERRYGDGSLQRAPDRWEGRTLERVSVFSELQAPVLPRRLLPASISSFEVDLAARYIVADSSAESNLAPTVALKLGLPNGLTFRGSFTTSNRFPTPFMSRNLGNGVDGGTGLRTVRIFDQKREEDYLTTVRPVRNPSLRSESAVTQTFGILYTRGERHRLRASLDFFDTQKTNEIVGLGANDLINLESFFPELVERDAPAPGSNLSVGRVRELRTGAINLASRHSQNLMLTLDYARLDFLGGTLDLRTRVVYFHRFDREIFPNESAIDELNAPSGSAPGLLSYRATLGGGWSMPHFAFGMDGQYFHSRRLPMGEWASQGARTIDPYWQGDFYAQADLGHWLLAENSRVGLKAQLRVNNVFKNSYPRYVREASGAGVQPYDDWRGRTFSLSLKAEF
ncbi:MAG: hypothetical protein SynsKO_16090 [Synoicihabitans sp.]